jgi:hypothetical protein
VKRLSSPCFVAALICLPVCAQAQYSELQEGDRVMTRGGGWPDAADVTRVFTRRCPTGQQVAGFDLSVGRAIDAGDGVYAIRPICVTALAPAVIGPRPESVWGASGVRLLCPDGSPVVTKIMIELQKEHTTDPRFDNAWSVNGVDLYCGLVARPQLRDVPGPKHRGGRIVVVGTNAFDGYRIRQEEGAVDFGYNTCADGLVAVGITGQSLLDQRLDSLGLICGYPVITEGQAVKPAARVKLPDGVATTAPLRSTCERAQIARERNSPAAPGLEELCKARQGEIEALRAKGAKIADSDPDAGELRDQQREGPPRRGFEIGLAAAGGDTLPGPGKDRVRDMLDPAEQDGFTTAVNFSLSHNRQKISDSAGRGRDIAGQDPLAMELRGEQPDEDARLGFDIGMAAAEGHTAPGPGKDRIRDSLPQTQRGGFSAAVTFSIDRNKNAELAANGAAIARQDRLVAAARAAEADAMHRLGFDIATGIFGDPAMGARGNTAKGPGSLGIRDGLSFLAQRGFNASMAFHLSRDYQR